MRLKNLKKYYLKNRIIVSDVKEGGRFESFSETAIPIEANIYDKESRVESSVSGKYTVTEKMMLLSSDGVRVIYDNTAGGEKYVFSDGSSFMIGDGVCVYTTAEGYPDFKIASIILAGHLVCRLERTHGRSG